MKQDELELKKSNSARAATDRDEEKNASKSVCNEKLEQFQKLSKDIKAQNKNLMKFTNTTMHHYKNQFKAYIP